MRYYRPSGCHLSGLQRNRLQLLSSEALTTQLEYGGVIKDAIQGAQKRGVFLEILPPQRWILIAGKDHVEAALFVVPPVNQVKEETGILLVKGTVANLFNNQTGRPHKAIQTGIGLAGASCSRKPVSQLRGLNEVSFQPVLAAGIAKGLG